MKALFSNYEHPLKKKTDSLKEDRGLEIYYFYFIFLLKIVFLIFKLTKKSHSYTKSKTTHKGTLNTQKCIYTQTMPHIILYVFIRKTLLYRSSALINHKRSYHSYNSLND